jgi:outer membrane lipoprotein-sorting protein
MTWWGSALHAAAHNGTLVQDAHLARFTRLEGQFKQTKNLKELDLEIKTEGDFKVLRPTETASVFYWNILKPKPSHICIDEVGILIDSADGNPEKKKNLKFSEVGKETGDQIVSLLKIITMDPNKIDEEFAVQKGANNYVLTPKKKEAAFFESATLSVNAKGLVQQVTILEKSQDQIRIEFLNLKTKNTPVPKDVACPR